MPLPCSSRCHPNPNPSPSPSPNPNPNPSPSPSPNPNPPQARVHTGAPMGKHGIVGWMPGFHSNFLEVRGGSKGQ